MSKNFTIVMLTLACFALATSADAVLVARYSFDSLNNAAGLSGPALTAAGTGHTVGVAGGIVGNAVEFTGTTGNVLNAAIGFGGSGSNQLADNFTVSAWYNLDTDASSDASRFFVYEGDADYDISYGLRGLAGEPGFNDSQTFTNGIGSRDHIDVHTPGTWQQVLMTYESDGTTTTLRTYVDGVLTGAPLVGATANLTSAGINFGNARGTALNRAFDGKIDEIAIWDEVLSPGRIAKAYAFGLDGQTIPNVIPEPLAGDADDDGDVDENDFFLISDNLSNSVIIGTNGDVDFDAQVTFADFRLWKDVASPAALAAAGFAVPEPSTVVLLGGVLTIVGLVHRRRRSMP